MTPDPQRPRPAYEELFALVEEQAARIKQVEAVATRHYPVVGDVSDERWLAGYKRGIERVRDDLLAALREDKP